MGVGVKFKSLLQWVFELNLRANVAMGV